MIEHKAKITRKGGYYCAPKGSIVEHFEYGTVVTGVVAKMATADLAAQRMLEPKKHGRPPKAKKGE